jgi:hypothetical protein
MVSKKKKSSEAEVKTTPVFNPFENPELALESGSDENIALLVGNDIELPEQHEILDDDDGLRNQIKDLVSSISTSYWSLAEKLAFVFDQKRYKSWGYPTFEAYADQEIGMKRTKAYDLANIYKYFTVTLKEKLQDQQLYNQVITDVKDLGWNKALKIATEKVIDKDNAKEVIDTAKTSTLKELDFKCKEIIEAMPQEKQEERKEEVEKTTKKSFHLNLWQADVVDNTIDKVKKMMREGANDSSALVFMCQDFNSSNQIPKSQGDVSEYLSKVERTLGIRILATTSDYSKIIYGTSLIDSYNDKITEQELAEKSETQVEDNESVLSLNTQEEQDEDDDFEIELEEI